MPRNPILPLIALLPIAALPLGAQTKSRATAAAGAPLGARMEASLREVEESPDTGLAAYFPRRGDWTWVQTLRDDGGGPDRTGIWRFPAVETKRAIGAGGPVCDSFDEGGGHSGPWEGRFGRYAGHHEGRWRRVRGNRFVPPGADASSRWFVEWRREDGRWVVSAFGDEDVLYTPRPPQRPTGPFVPDAAPAAEDTVFAPAGWYTIPVEGMRHPTYGRPRPIDPRRSRADRPPVRRERVRAAGTGGRLAVPARGARPVAGIRAMGAAPLRVAARRAGRRAPVHPFTTPAGEIRKFLSCRDARSILA